MPLFHGFWAAALLVLLFLSPSTLMLLISLLMLDCVPPPSLGATVPFAPKEKETVSPSAFCHST